MTTFHAHTLEHFLTVTSLKMTVVPAPENPYMEGDKWECDNWFYTLNTPKRHMSGYFSTGIGHRTYNVGEARRLGLWNSNKFKAGDRLPSRFVVADAQYAKAFIPTAPTIAAILYCLASDASGIDNARTFEEWASDLGYDTDSRTAHKTYKVTKRQTQKLKALLGPEWYALLLDTENDG
jgi:hypothetical protein